MDKLSKSQRRRNMQAVKCSNSKIEKLLAKALRSKGHSFRRNYSKIIGKPDMAFILLRIAIFCDSEFWHGKNWSKKKREIKSNRKFWHSKIERNITRDKEVNKELRKIGWRVLRFWGKEIITNTDNCVKIIEKSIKSIKNEKKKHQTRTSGPKQ